MLQAHVVARAVDVAKLKQIAADHSLHLSVHCIDGANDVRLAIGDVKRLPDYGHARRLGETGPEQRTVETRFATGAGESRDRVRVEIEFPDLMRASHRDVKRLSDELQIPR